MEYFSSLKPKLIYVFRIPDTAHKDCLKIGEATFEDGNITLPPNSSALNKAARARIDQYTKTAGIAYDLLHTEIAITVRGGAVLGFNDKEVHDVLLRSGIKRKVFDQVNGANEWFCCDLETAKKAIDAVKEGRKALHASDITAGQSPIQFRPEQREAIDKTLKQFKKGNRMLWNAKMRFGKTLSALEVVKERGDFRRVLILTHRPVVDAGWYEDFQKIFYDTPDFLYGSKTNGETFRSLESRAKARAVRYVYFASMQDLRGSQLVGGNFDKNSDIFSTPWDIIIVDEAHEGTQTELGKAVMEELTKQDTKVLQLSGTPFNLVDKVKEDELFTWDYVMEQRAKAQWDELHPGDHNPYAGLPRLNIYTYDLGRLMDEYADEDIAFNFREFFRTKKDDTFVHKAYVENFLNLLTKNDEESLYPFSNKRFRDIFRHTLWMVPGVRSAKALSAMLKNHPVFGMFEIVNVAGDGDEEDANDEALRKVEKAIGKDPDQTRTITLSCGRLTTGVSVKPWTGVFMLSGSFNTAATAYMQTIFRVQTPATINGRVKEDCYVFDFAPDRTLKILDDTVKKSLQAGNQGESYRRQLGEFLNFCPIISVGGKMKRLDTVHMLQLLKRVYVERVVQNGFEDGYLYNDELMKLTDLDIKEFAELKCIIGQTKAIERSNDLPLNRQGLTNEEYAEKEKLEKKKKRELTEEEKARLEELKKKKKVKEDAISILRGISTRMPLMIYGAKVEDEDEELTIDNFTSLIDPQSWEEFMPRGVTKQRFNAFKKYYDPDIFTAASKRIRQMARAADRLSIEGRIERIAAIFATFRNPDKETVLTPWRVVNMHMSDTLGGYTFFNEDFSETIEEPRFVDRGNVTADVFTPDSHLLEINSKSGLYPLYLAYNVYRARLRNSMFSPETLEEHQALWDAAVAENIFVICKTPMAKRITERTLLGFRKGKTNMQVPDNLINKIKNQPDLFIKEVSDLVGKNVKINAIVGNPPYQVNDGSGASDDASNPVYQDFVNISKMLKPQFISIIMPSKWMVGGKVILKPFRSSMMNDNHISLIVDYENDREIFPTAHNDGGICYFLYNDKYDQNGFLTYVYQLANGEILSSVRTLKDGNTDIIIRDNRRLSIIAKVSKDEESFKKIVSLTQPYGIRKDLFNSPERYASAHLSETPFDGSVKIYGVKGIKGGAKRTEGYITSAPITKNGSTIDMYKLFFTTSYSTNATNPPSVIIGDKNEICTETFLLVGPFSTKLAQLNCKRFFDTNFFKILLFFGRGTMQVSRDVFRFIPLQNFNENSDIDWSKSVEEIDRQLYKKYHLSDTEIAFIESMIKPM